MVRFFHTRFFSAYRKLTVTVLASALCAGYLFGALLAAQATGTSVSLIHDALISSVSITRLLPVMILPFLVSAFAVHLRQQWLFLPLAFCRSFGVSYLSALILCSFDYAGWLLTLLFLFSDFFSLALLCWFWIHSVAEGSRRPTADTALVLLSVIGIVSFDCHLVSPFLVSLLI